MSKQFSAPQKVTAVLPAGAASTSETVASASIATASPQVTAAASRGAHPTSPTVQPASRDADTDDADEHTGRKKSPDPSSDPVTNTTEASKVRVLSSFGRFINLSFEITKCF